MQPYATPGVYTQDIFPVPEPLFVTGVPIFLGYAHMGPINEPTMLTLWPQFEALFGGPCRLDIEGSGIVYGHLYDAVRGFFENGGQRCYVVCLDHIWQASLPEVQLRRPGSSSDALAQLRSGLQVAIGIEDADLVCAPDAVIRWDWHSDQTYSATVADLQIELLYHCHYLGNRMALLDAISTQKNSDIVEQRRHLFDMRRPLPSAAIEDVTENVANATANDIAGDAESGAAAGAEDTSNSVASTESGSDEPAGTLPSESDASAELERVTDDASAAPTDSHDSLNAEDSNVESSNVESSNVENSNAALNQGYNVRNSYGALYHPWIVSDRGDTIPPCGHVAGTIAAGDQQVGVHQPPANEPLNGVSGLASDVSTAEQVLLFNNNINVLRPFTGRGIRVWGARTLTADPDWQQVNVRRLFITVARWMEQFLGEVAHEPHDMWLWLRIMRETSAFLDALYQQGALKGPTADTSYYVKCDADTNPPAVINRGQIVTEIGLAPAVPSEFIDVRIVHGDNGVSLSV